MARPKGSAPAGETKARIRKVAAELFTKNGFHGTSMAELSDAVGLGKGALYYHIDSKEALLFEICSEHVYEMTSFGQSILSSDVSAIDKFERLSRRLLDTISKNRNELTLTFRELGSLTGDRRSSLLKVRDEYEKIWLRVLQEGAESGEFRPVDPVLVKGILGMHNYAYVWIHDSGRLSPDEISAAFRNVLLAGLVRPAGTPD